MGVIFKMQRTLKGGVTSTSTSTSEGGDLVKRCDAFPTKPCTPPKEHQLAHAMRMREEMCSSNSSTSRVAFHSTFTAAMAGAVLVIIMHSLSNLATLSTPTMPP
jgi:hypothetical protein